MYLTQAPDILVGFCVLSECGADWCYPTATFSRSRSVTFSLPTKLIVAAIIQIHKVYLATEQNIKLVIEYTISIVAKSFHFWNVPLVIIGATFTL